MGELKTSLRKIGVACAFGAVLAGSTLAMAADLPSTKAPVPVAPVVDDFEPFFVKLGVTYAINTSSSRLAGPLAARILGAGDFGTYPQNVGATLSNVTTLGFEAGYFVTRNISIDVSGGIPIFVKTTTKGFNPLNPPLANGTLLGQSELSVVPVTVVYHLNQFGPIQPYAGAGFAPGFSFANKDAFLTGVKVGGSVGLALQAGADYMIDQHWGVSVDVKKIFAYAEAHASGVLPLQGTGIPTNSTIHTNFQPWLISGGLVYRFGAPDPVVAKY